MLDRDRYWDCLDQAMEASSGGRVQEALGWLEEALRAHPGGAEAHNGRGEIFWDNGHCQEALQAFARAVEADPELHAAQLNRIEILIEEFQEQDQALELCNGLLAGKLERGVEAEVYYLKAKALFYLDDLEGALFLLRRALKAHGEVGVYRGFEGQILFEMGRFHASQQSLDRSRALDPDSAHTLYHSALVAEHVGSAEEAERLFARAANLAPDLYPLPVRMSEAEFKDAARQALDSLPESIRSYVRNCPILIKDLPGSDLVLKENLSPQVLGIFEGVPRTAAGHSGGGELSPDGDAILLFKRNLEKVAVDPRSLVEQIQITVKHEIGHYLGLGEDELERLGLA